MKVFKIPESLYNKYHGCGYAIGAAMNDTLIDFVYLRDINQYFDDENIDDVKRAIEDESIASAVRYMSSLGEVYVGMCSAYEFVEV